ncbi:MAG: hypothetical protein Kow00121_26660 [Elainellaceae cyanobacterium]
MAEQKPPLNQADVHRETGLAKNTISNLYRNENDRIQYDTIVKLCEFFDCEIGDLLELVDEEEEE